MSYKSYFDIPSEITYLTTPGSGLLSIETKQWRQERDTIFFDTKGSLREEQGVFLSNCRESIGSFFHCDSERVILSTNFSTAYTSLLSGLPKDLNILLLEDDYPSVNFPVILNGFSYHFTKINSHLESNILEAIEKHQPQVLILSLVQYISGIQLDLNLISKIKELHPDLLIIADGTQFLGTELFDFENSGLDAVLASGYKWLLGGYGNGFALLSNRLKNLLFKEVQEKFSHLDRVWQDKNVLQFCFEPGHIDTLSLGTLQQSLKQLSDWGLNNTISYTKSIVEKAKQEFSRRRLLLPDVEARSISSNIFNLQIDPKNFEKLIEEGIKCFPRGSGIRIGFHLYNDENDLDKLLSVIDHKLK